MTYSLRIADLPSDERPRERLMNVGPKSLSNAELIAILLGTGQGAGKLSAVGLGQHILQHLGQCDRNPLDVLRTSNPRELMEINGVGPAKATTILAAIELGKRVFQTRALEPPTIDNPGIAANYLSQELMWNEQEYFSVLFLDTKNRAFGFKTLTIGTATETLVSTPELFREIFRQGANRAIVAHNHPSGCVDPSQADLDLTKKLLYAGRELGVPILDHLILGGGNYRSLRESTLLWNEYPQGD